ncbi:MAG: hypothetical protein IPL91_02055 [Hyphomicrobium sp.]|nr:hypothetical protein [Hyphomicrobium sp.]
MSDEIEGVKCGRSRHGEVVSIGIDIAAPYSRMDMMAVETAIATSARYIEVGWKSLDLPISSSSIKKHMLLSLEDDLFSTARSFAIADTLLNRQPDCVLIHVNSLRALTMKSILARVDALKTTIWLVADDPVGGAIVFQKWRKGLAKHGEVTFRNWSKRPVKRIISAPSPDHAPAPHWKAPALSENCGLIIATGDSNYTTVVEAIAREMSAFRPVCVWTLYGTFTPEHAEGLPNVSVAPIELPLGRAPLEQCGPRIHDHEEPDKVLREALEEQCSVWRARKAPMLAGLFEAILDEFERNPPAYVVVSSGRSPIARLVIEAARCCGILTMDVQAVILSDYARIKRPATDWVAVMGTISLHLLAGHFKFPKSKILVAGSARIDSMLKAGALSDKAFTKTVLFASQPLDSVLTGAAAEHLIKAVGAVDGASLNIRLHPREGDDAIDRYEALIARAGAGNYCAISPKEESLRDSVEKADLVATFFSNVGLEAAILNRDVLAIALDGHFPVDLSKDGLALRARNPDELDDQVTQYLTDPAFRAVTRDSRLAFLKVNQQFVQGKSARRIVEHMESLAG